MAAQNKSLGKFVLDGIPPAPRGIPQIEVTFDIDANGILHVEAADKGTGKKQKITVSGSTKLSDAEVERMRKDAEEHAAEDAAFKEKADARNQADAAAFQAENLIKESGDKLGSHKPAVEAALKDLKDTVANTDASVEDLKAKTEALHKALEPAVMEMYKQAEAAGGQPGAGPEAGNWSGKPEGGASGDGNGPIDADFTTKSKKKDE
jgi:molecular chaperone DnaK